MKRVMLQSIVHWSGLLERRCHLERIGANMAKKMRAVGARATFEGWRLLVKRSLVLSRMESRRRRGLMQDGVHTLMAHAGDMALKERDSALAQKKNKLR